MITTHISHKQLKSSSFNIKQSFQNQIFTNSVVSRKYAQQQQQYIQRYNTRQFLHLYRQSFNCTCSSSSISYFTSFSYPRLLHTAKRRILQLKLFFYYLSIYSRFRRADCPCCCPLDCNFVAFCLNTMLKDLLSCSNACRRWLGWMVGTAWNFRFSKQNIYTYIHTYVCMHVCKNATSFKWNYWKAS